MSRELKFILKKNSGRNSSGQVVVRHQGGRHKRFYRTIDFRRDKLDVVGVIRSIEFDPNRTVDIALVQYVDGDKRYILAPVGLSVGDRITSGDTADIRPGNAIPLGKIPVGTMIHNIELSKGKGGQIVRSAGNQAMIMARENEYVHVRLPSGEIRRIFGKNFATIGQLGNIEWKDRILGKAGTSRHLGIRPQVRGVAMSPRSHPHGGGEGRSGIGMATVKTYTGKRAFGKTRARVKYSDKFIVKKRSKKKE